MIETPEPPVKGRSSSPEPRRLSVVLADNDPVLLDLMATDLALEHHDIVATALTGEAATAACEEWRPDVLVVDYRMPPGCNGLEAIQRVRDAGWVRDCVLYTNYRSPDIAKRVGRLGAIYLHKGPLRTLRATLAEIAAKQAQV